MDILLYNAINIFAISGCHAHLKAQTDCCANFNFFLQETQKRDFKYSSFLSSFAKIVNNSTPDYQCTRRRSF